MAKFRVTSPQGDTYEITAPEDATPEHIKAYMAQQFNRPNKDSSAKAKNKGLLAAIKNSPVGGIVRGLRDPIDAGAQLLEGGLSAIGVDTGAINRAVGMPSADEAYRQSEDAYKNDWRRGELEGLDVGRLAGNVAAALPVGAAATAGRVATTLPQMVRQGAAVGALTGAMTPVDTTREELLPTKLEQAALGGALGAAAPVVINSAVRGIKSMLPARKPGVKEIAQEVSEQLANRGVDFNKLSTSFKESVLKDVDDALKGGKPVDFDAVSRAADFEKLGIKPTLGQLTQNPMQIKFERNTAGIQDIGEGLTNRYREQAGQLVSKLPQSAPLASMDNNSAVVQALRNVDASNLARATERYDRAMAAGGNKIPVSGQTMAAHAKKALDDQLLTESLPGGLSNYLNQLQGGRALNIGEAQSKVHAINAGMSKIPDRTDRAAAIVKEKLRQHMQIASRKANNAAAAEFRAADSAYKQRMRAQETMPALKSAVDPLVKEDDFIRKHVISNNAGARDVMRLKATLRQDPKAWEAVRAEVTAFLRKGAVGNKSDEFAKFSPSGFDRALNAIGEPKMRVLFSREELDGFKRLSRVANLIENQPKGVTINNSGTSQALADFAMRTSKLPYIKELIQPLRNMSESKKVAAALDPKMSATLGKEALKSLPKRKPAAISNRTAVSGSIAAYPLINNTKE